MKRRSRFLKHAWFPAICAICTLVLALCISGAGAERAAAAEDCVLRVGWEPYAPFTFAGPDGGARGADIDILTAIAEDIGCRLTFHEMPWARILVEVQDGKIDATSSVSWTDDRSDWAFFSIPYRRAETALFVRRGGTERFPLESLEDGPRLKFRLGYNTGYHYHDMFQALMADPEFVAWTDGAVDYQTNIRKLIHGRVDGFIVEDVVVMGAEMAALGARDSLERHTLPLPSEALHIMLSRESVPEETFAAFNASLQRMKSDGRLDAIIARYANPEATGPSATKTAEDG